MTEDQPMFEVPTRWLAVGDRVTVQTIWGDEEGTVSRVSTGHLAVVALDSGPTLHVSPARVVVHDG